jgi:hypothetical protein
MEKESLKEKALAWPTRSDWESALGPGSGLRPCR